ncbi:MAG TPA: 2,3-bisphosphoglycerate-dependent phosphoglycerate mutase [Fimbriimonadales bacterium]|jgi:2,3-bisphosphoglycerate-dependent phosphoglycerate mutase|nr:2,3-bisphosphoglycerate-dependent phosphoglycerate mutase [Fimbriimonadales bacterium]
MPILVLVRHGQSIWNAEDRFTGWIDVPLSSAGEEEARQAGRLLKDFEFQVAYTSALMRAQDTLAIMLDEMGKDMPIIRDSALNERMYGNLQGLNKEQTRKRYSPEIVHLWRRSYDIPPPGGEALKDTAARTLPFFERAIMGDISQGKNVLVAAHGNSNRSIVMAVEGLTGEQVVTVELATGTPYVYELDASGKMLGKKILALNPA